MITERAAPVYGSGHRVGEYREQPRQSARGSGAVRSAPAAGGYGPDRRTRGQGRRDWPDRSSGSIAPISRSHSAAAAFDIEWSRAKFGVGSHELTSAQAGSDESTAAIAFTPPRPVSTSHGPHAGQLGGPDPIAGRLYAGVRASNYQRCIFYAGLPPGRRERRRSNWAPWPRIPPLGLGAPGRGTTCRAFWSSTATSQRRTHSRR